MSGLLRELPGDPGLELSIRDGIEHWDGGEIQLTVDGAGHAEVRHRRAGDERRYRDELDAERLGRLAARLDELGFASLRSIHRNHVPDEFDLTFRIVRDGVELLHAEIPAGERYDDERLGAIMDEFDALVEDVTGGDLPHGPAAAPR